MTVPRAATAVLLALLLTPLLGIVQAKEDDGLETTCIRTRVLDGDALLNPILSATGSTVTLGVDTGGSRYLVIVTPNMCVPNTDPERAAAQADHDVRDTTEGQNVRPLLP